MYVRGLSVSVLLGIRALARQSDFYLDVLGNRELRYLPHRPVVRLDVDDPSVNPELPVVERVRPLARRGFPRGDLQYLRRERLRALAPDTRLLCDVFDLPGEPLQLSTLELVSLIRAYCVIFIGPPLGWILRSAAVGALCGVL